MVFKSLPNNVSVTLAAPHAAGSGTFTLAPGGGELLGDVSASNPVRFTVVTDASYGTAAESLTIFMATGRDGDVLSGVTPLEGTPDRVYQPGDRLEVRATRDSFGDIHDAIGELEVLSAAHAPLIDVPVLSPSSDDRNRIEATGDTNALQLKGAGGAGAAHLLACLDGSDTVVFAVSPNGGIIINPVTSTSAVYIGRRGGGAGAGERWMFALSNAAGTDNLGFGCASTAYATGGTIPWIGNGDGFLYLPGSGAFKVGQGTGAAAAALRMTIDSAAGVTIPRLTYPRGANPGEDAWFLDYQDEGAFLDRRATVTATPAYTGSIASLFKDDTSFINWTAGSTPWPVVIEGNCTLSPIAVKGVALYAIGLTMRSGGSAAALPTRAKIEYWNSASGGSYSVVHDADIGFPSNYGQWVSPFLASPEATGNLTRFKVTLTGGTVGAGETVRVQRLQVYHSSQTWDPWHLHAGGGTLYGPLNFAGQAAPASPVNGDMWLDSTQLRLARRFGGMTASDSAPIFGYVPNPGVAVTATGSQSLFSASGMIGMRTLAAGFLNVVGRTLRCRFGGFLSTAGTAGAHYFFFQLGGATVATSFTLNPTNSLTNMPVTGWIDIATKAAGAVGKLDCHGMLWLGVGTGAPFAFLLGNGTTAGTMAAQAQITIDLTPSLTLDFRVSRANSGNSITLTNFTIEVLA